MAVVSSGTLNQQLNDVRAFQLREPQRLWRASVERVMRNMADTVFNISGSGASQQSIVYVNDVSDLPDPSGAEIALDPNIIYRFTANVDIGARYIKVNQNNAILGFNPNNSGITNNYAGPLISGSEDFTMTSIQLQNQNASGQVISYDGRDASTSRRSLTLNDITWLSSDLGDIRDMNNVLSMANAYINVQQGFMYSGEIDSFVVDTCILVSSVSGAILYDFDPDTVINSRVRSVFSNFTSNTGSIVWNIPNTITVRDEGVQFFGNQFSSSGGAFVSGVLGSSPKALYENNIGLRSSAPRVHYYMVNNATATTIAAVNGWYKVAGTTIAASSESFSHSTNRATYQLNRVRNFLVTATMSATGGNGNNTEFAIALNGAIQSSSITARSTQGAGNRVAITTQELFFMNDGDYFEIFLRNTSNTNSVTIVDLNVIATQTGGG